MSMRYTLVALLLVGCAQQKASPTAALLTTLDVQLVDPPPDGLGSPMAPVDVKQATFNVIAHDEQGNVVNQDVDVDVFISFGGVKTGANSACGADESGTQPIERVTLKGGMLMNHTVQLPLAFGSTSIWVDEPVSGATGASPTIYFRNAFIAEAQTPADLTATNATFCSPFNGKFLVFDHATGTGQLVVTAVYSNAFTVTDTGVAPGQFNSIYLFAFGKPPSDIVEGRVITDFSGNYSKFVGFTELNFPLFNVADNTVPLAPVPPPVPLTYCGHRQHRQDAGRVVERRQLHGHDLQSVAAQPDERSEHPEDDRQLEQVQPVRRRQRPDLRRLHQHRRRAAVEGAGQRSIRCRASARARPSPACCATTRGRTRISTPTATPSPARRRCPAPRGPASPAPATRTRSTSGPSIRAARKTSSSRRKRKNRFQFLQGIICAGFSP